MNKGIVQYFFASLFFIGLSSNLYGQSCAFSLSGRVMDLHDETPIFGALVSIEGTTFFTQTDASGFYEIRDLCAGTFTLVISHVECNSLEKKINLRGDEIFNFELEHHINELDEIILSDSKLDEISTSVKEARLDKDQIKQNSSQSLAEALSATAGVGVLQTGTSITKPMIHGMYGSRVGIIANGVRLKDQEW